MKNNLENCNVSKNIVFKDKLNFFKDKFEKYWNYVWASSSVDNGELFVDKNFSWVYIIWEKWKWTADLVIKTHNQDYENYISMFDTNGEMHTLRGIPPRLYIWDIERENFSLNDELCIFEEKIINLESRLELQKLAKQGQEIT